MIIDCARCAGKAQIDELKAIDKIGDMLLFTGYCDGEPPHRVYVIMEGKTKNAWVISLPSGCISKAYGLNLLEEERVKHL